MDQLSNNCVFFSNTDYYQAEKSLSKHLSAGNLITWQGIVNIDNKNFVLNHDGNIMKNIQHLRHKIKHNYATR